MSLQIYNADYWPGKHTTALMVVRANVDIFWKCKGKTFPCLVGLLPCKGGLRKVVHSVVVWTGINSIFGLRHQAPLFSMFDVWECIISSFLFACRMCAMVDMSKIMHVLTLQTGFLPCVHIDVQLLFHSDEGQGHQMCYGGHCCYLLLLLLAYQNW